MRREQMVVRMYRKKDSKDEREGKDKTKRLDKGSGEDKEK